jgi:hypothetical protein
MRLILAFITFVFGIIGCNKRYDNFLLEKNKEKIIALQPLDEYDTILLQFISNEISYFYNRKVIIKDPITIPGSIRLRKELNIYSADSILNRVAEMLKGDIIAIVAFTHKDIYIAGKGNFNADKPLFDYNVQPVSAWEIFPGTAA